MTDTPARAGRRFERRAERRGYARGRLADGAGLTPDERERLLALLAQAGRAGADAGEDLARIADAIGHYWHMLASRVDDEAGRLAEIAHLAARLSQALVELPQHYLQAQADVDGEWSLVGVDPRGVRAIDDGADVLPVVEFQPALRRQPAGCCGQGGSRVALVQHAVERLEQWASTAQKSERGKPVERELRWLLTGLRRVWVERLGRPFAPQGGKRGGVAEFVGQIVAIADPALPAATAISLLRMLPPFLSVCQEDGADTPPPLAIDALEAEFLRQPSLEEAP